MYLSLYFPEFHFQRTVNERYLNDAFIRSLKFLELRLSGVDSVNLSAHYDEVFDFASSEIKSMKYSANKLITLYSRPISLGFW